MEEVEVPVGKVHIFPCLLLWKNCSFFEIAYQKARLHEQKLMSFGDGIFITFTPSIVLPL